MRLVSLLVGANDKTSNSGDALLFPLKSVKEFEKAEEQLQSEELFANYVRYCQIKQIASFLHNNLLHCI